MPYPLPAVVPSTFRVTTPSACTSWKESVPALVVIRDLTVPVTVIVMECPLYAPEYGIAWE